MRILPRSCEYLALLASAKGAVLCYRPDYEYGRKERPEDINRIRLGFCSAGAQLASAASRPRSVPARRVGTQPNANDIS